VFILLFQIAEKNKFLDLKGRTFFSPFNSKYFHKRLCAEFRDENDDAVIVVCRNEVKDFPGIFLFSLFLYLLHILHIKADMQQQ